MGKLEGEQKATTVATTKRMPPDQKESRVAGATAAPTELRDMYEGSEGYVDREDLADSTPDNNYKEICSHCVIRDIIDVGCNNCGIYHYVARLKDFRIQVTRR